MNFEFEWLAILRFYIGPSIIEIYKQLDPILGGKFEIRKFGIESQPIQWTFEQVRLSVLLTNQNPGSRTFFPRQNCSVANPQQGSAILHPGRLTHPYAEETVKNNQNQTIILDSLINIHYLWTMAGFQDVYNIPGMKLVP